MSSSLARNLTFVNSSHDRLLELVDIQRREQKRVTRQVRAADQRRLRGDRRLACGADATCRRGTANAEARGPRSTQAARDEARFFRLATTSASPIMGPSQLTADDLVAYIDSLHLDPPPASHRADTHARRATTSRRARPRVSGATSRSRSRFSRPARSRSRSRAADPDRQQLRGHRRVRQLQARRSLRLRADRCAGADPAPADLCRSHVRRRQGLREPARAPPRAPDSGSRAASRPGTCWAAPGRRDPTTGSTSTTST